MNYRNYAKTMLELKNLKISGKNIARATRAIKIAYNTVYKAVAFDIDGTITSPSLTDIDHLMAWEIGKLLRRGVPVVLITGRGRTLAREGVRQIINATGLDIRYASRLSCITHNGLLWLKAPANNPEAILQEEIPLAPEFYELPEVRKQLTQDAVIKQGLANETIKISSEPTEHPLAIRITMNADDQSTVSHVSKKLEELIESISISRREPIYLTSGIFGNHISYDITPTNKVKAVEFFSKATGIRLGEILRVGDQGEKGGNDFEFLNSSRAFSVDRFGSQLDKCFPVIGDSSNVQLKGVSATQALLKRVKIYPPLTLCPDPQHNHLRALQRFEKAALSRARREQKLLLEQMKLRINRMLTFTHTSLDLEQIDIGEIYQVRNGGVRIRDWEIPELDENHPVRKLFGLQDSLLFDEDTNNLKWACFTDDAFLLRGANYYWAMMNDTCEAGYMAKYRLVVKGFFEGSIEAIRQLSKEEPNLTKFKFVLGVMDNIRNILIQIQYAIYVSDIIGKKGYSYSAQFFNQILAVHTELHFNCLLNANLHWSKLLNGYAILLEKISKSLDEYFVYVTPYELGFIKPLIRKWRECDDFLQNILAVQIGIHEFEETLIRSERNIKSISLIGLVYGGLELPAIACAVAKNEEIPIVPGFLNLSLYGDQSIRTKLLKEEIGAEDIILNQDDQISTLALFEGRAIKQNLEGRYSIIMDDNCTTGRTIQSARDILVKNGAEVVGAIVVRYPGSNRYLEMQFPNHGLPDPEVLLSFIRGLVSPSYYTRLIKTGKDISEVLRESDNPSKVYLDSTGIFDMSRWELERFLTKSKF
jgi:hydroxymethylpyrimidine pyrophosphatase-like HAD family hydrolase/pyrimidine operon attenuation protein/uracil phosphoribosyltransferase